MPDFDAIIIRAGQAGPSLAFRLAGAGMKLAVLERHLVDGICVNTGRTPTKALPPPFAPPLAACGGGSGWGWRAPTPPGSRGAPPSMVW